MRALFRKLHSDRGMTLAETLMAVLIMSIIFTAVGGGVVVMKNNYEKVTLKAQAQTLLATTISAINADLEAATSVYVISTVTPPSSGDYAVKEFYSTRRNMLMTFVSDEENASPKQGVQVKYGSGETAVKQPLVNSGEKITKTLFTEMTEFKYHIPGTTDAEYYYFKYKLSVKLVNNPDKEVESITIDVNPYSEVEVRTASS